MPSWIWSLGFHENGIDMLSRDICRVPPFLPCLVADPSENDKMLEISMKFSGSLFSPPYKKQKTSNEGNSVTAPLQMSEWKVHIPSIIYIKPWKCTLRVLTTLEQQRRLKPVPSSNVPLRTPRARQIPPKANIRITQGSFENYTSTIAQNTGTHTGLFYCSGARFKTPTA